MGEKAVTNFLDTAGCLESVLIVVLMLRICEANLDPVLFCSVYSKQITVPRPPTAGNTQSPL